MSENILPSEKDVLQHFYHIKFSLGNPHTAIQQYNYNGSFLSLVAYLTAQDVIKIYQRGKIPVQVSDTLRNTIQRLYEGLKNVQKKTGKTAKNIQHKQKYLEKIEGLFNATTRSYVNDIYATRDKETAETDIEWLNQVDIKDQISHTYVCS